MGGFKKTRAAFKKSGLPELGRAITKSVKPVRPTIFGDAFKTKKVKKGQSIELF